MGNLDFSKKTRYNQDKSPVARPSHRQSMPFAFDTDNPWSRCLSAFLTASFDRSHSSETLRIYQRALYRFFSEPAKMPEDYTREDVSVFIHRPSADGKAPAVSTVNQRLSALRSFYSYAATYTIEGADGHPVAILRHPAPTSGFRHGRADRVYRAMSYEEFTQFFAVIPKDTSLGLRDRSIFLFYFWTARRRAEIQRLTWGDIEQGTIIDEGGSRRVGWLYHFRNKGSSTQDDVAELPQAAKVALDKYLIASGRMATIQATDPLFVAEGSNRPLSFVAIFKAMKKYLKAAGLDGRGFSIHSWRHTAARARYAAGEDIRSLQRLLRHSSLATTDTYLRALAGTSNSGARLLEDRFNQFS